MNNENDELKIKKDLLEKNSNKNNSNKNINKLLNTTQNIINMSNNLTNNMISSLTYMSNNLASNNDSPTEYVNKVDIKTIVSNAKKDKRFYKLLNLCIKHGIHLFNQYNEICTLLSNDNLIKQAEDKQRQISIEFSISVANISNKNDPGNLLADIETIYTGYKKKFKEIEVIIYILKNTYDDVAFEDLCCVKTNINQINTSSNSSISPSNMTSSQTTISATVKTKSSETNKKIKKEKLSKYIAIYSN